MSTEPTLTGKPEETAKYGLLDRIAGLFFEPGTVFRSLRRKPEYILPIILILLTGALTFLITMRTDFTAMLTAEQQEQLAKVPPAAMAVSGTIMVLLMTTAGWFLRSAVFLGLGKALGGEGKYGPVLSAQGYVLLPGFLGILAAAIIVFYTGRQIPLSLGIYLPLAQQGTPLGVLLAQVSPFVLGYLILAPIAVAETMGVSRRKAWGLVLAAWAVVVLLQVGMAVLGAALRPA